ncbi:hypothetical protein D6745_00480 [Candidatus Woesearchaeota archaeon]|nr:MAG: hypothetical protein D6745_00480 [Candidatus Woesearchaeota archaeon]
MEFFLNGTLVHTAYSDFEWEMNTTMYENGDYELEARAYDLSQLTSSDILRFTVYNIKDLAPPAVRMLSYVYDNTSGKINVTASISDDVGLDSARLYINGSYVDFHSFEPEYPKSANITLQWNVANQTLGIYDAVIEVMDTDNKIQAVNESINLSAIPSPPEREQPILIVTDHYVYQNGNQFLIAVEIKNVGNADAVDVVVKDFLMRFQPITYVSNSTGDKYIATYYPTSRMTSSDIYVNGTISPGQTKTLSFTAVPVLMYPRPPGPVIGHHIYLEWYSLNHTMYSDIMSYVVSKTVFNVSIASAYKAALRVSDYLITTDPKALFALGNSSIGFDEENLLLSSMAELASLENGVLGYIEFGKSTNYKTFHNLITPGGAWAKQMSYMFSNGYKGYLLIVGETEIFPSITVTGFNVKMDNKTYDTIKLSDQFFSDYDSDCTPELALGRVIGNKAKDLRNAIQTSVNVLMGNHGYGFDYSDALLFTGVGNYYFLHLDAADTLQSKLINKGVNVARVDTEDFRFFTSFSGGFNIGDGFAVGDVLGDSKNEILVADDITNVIHIFDANGNELHSFDGMYTTNDGFAVGDVLGDEKDEILVAGDQTHIINIFDGNSNGTPLNSFDGGFTAGNGFAVGNILGDVKDEILVAGDQTGYIDILNGSGDFLDGYPTIFSQGDGFAVGDVLGDTKDDIIIEDHNTNIIHIYTYPLATDLYFLGYNGNRLLTGDFKGMGKELIAQVDDVLNEIHLWNVIDLLNGTLTWEGKIQSFGSLMNDGFAAADFVGDAKDELIIASDMSGTIHFSDIFFEGAAFDAFAANATNKDLVFIFAHGNPHASGPISIWNMPHVNFSNSTPVALVVSCTTADYESSNDESLVEAFLDRNAAVYIGSTEVSSMNINHDVGESFFADYWEPQFDSIGRAYENQEIMLCLQDEPEKYWVYEYNLFGNPKYGKIGGGTASMQSTQHYYSSQFTGADINISVPFYNVTVMGNFDYVRIPGGFWLHEENKSAVPYYYEFVEYPKGYKIQNVSMTSKTGMVTDTGLNIPMTINEISSDPIDDFSMAVHEWYPEKEYDWKVINEPNSTKLMLIIYPFYYNALTTDVKFYRDYTFHVDYIVSQAEIIDVSTDKDEYNPGDIVNVTVIVNNTETQNIVVNAVIKQYPTGRVVDGIPLNTLTGLDRTASLSLQWDTAGFEQDYYTVEVSLIDTSGNILDKTSAAFRVGVSSAEVSMTAVPEIFNPGDSIRINLTVNNTGTMNITGVARIKIYNSTGNLSGEFNHNISNLSDSTSFVDLWNTTADENISFYNIIGYVLYDGKSTNITNKLVQTDFDTDGVGDALDNCVYDYNPDQADNDFDGVGDVCDNCPADYNPNQTDGDTDGYGAVCDCDDSKSGVNPGHAEVCSTSYDDDCDGTVNEGCHHGGGSPIMRKEYIEYRADINI